jgi:uncharacterized protein involved in cysteine biosynthesis
MQNVLGILKWTLVVVSLLFWLLVSLANQGVKIYFKLVPHSFEWQSFPLSSLILFIVTFAYIVFFLISIFDNLENVMEKRDLKKKISDLEYELKELRNEPIRKGTETDNIIKEEQKF